MVPEMEKSYPENRMFGTKLPASAFYIRHVKGLTLKDITVTYKTNDPRPAFYLDDVEGIRLKSVFIDGEKLHRAASLMVEKKSSQVEVID